MKTLLLLGFILLVSNVSVNAQDADQNLTNSTVSWVNSAGDLANRMLTSLPADNEAGKAFEKATLENGINNLRCNDVRAANEEGNGSRCLTVLCGAAVFYKTDVLYSYDLENNLTSIRRDMLEGFVEIRDNAHRELAIHREFLKNNCSEELSSDQALNTVLLNGISIDKSEKAIKRLKKQLKNK